MKFDALIGSSLSICVYVKPLYSHLSSHVFIIMSDEVARKLHDGGKSYHQVPFAFTSMESFDVSPPPSLFYASHFGCYSWRINCFSSRILLLDVDDDMSTALSALPCLLYSVCVYWMLWRKLISFIRRERCYEMMKKKDIYRMIARWCWCCILRKRRQKKVVISSGIWDDDERAYTIARV